MRFIQPAIHRRSEDDGSGGCPAEAVGCNANSDEHDLTPAQLSSRSQSLASSTASTTSMATISAGDGAAGTHNGTHVNPEAVGGIIVIAFLLLVFTLAIGYVTFGPRGERCCCTSRKRGRKDVPPEEGQPGQDEMSPNIIKDDSEARLIQTP